MQKDFDSWNEEKKQTNASEYLPFYREREIRWCRLGINIGFEQDGTGAGHARPVLVLKAFSRSVCLIVPLTTSEKKNPYHVAVGLVAGTYASAIISQLRLIDTKRLDSKLAVLDTATFEEIRKAVKAML